ncbi:TonB-dependent receptor [Thalassomonas sp. RHCl1]|uniref:TonB-dependent siderophore receptor n=1 Tax=Thalassomonas sp. RHCl1 TaxID=2995320 RepID=UPI00248AF595|nr:TonB-dependent receptor [Thalassomonas sp. RHCl1]
MNSSPSAFTLKKSLLASALTLAFSPAVVAEKASLQETAQNYEQNMEIIQVRGRASQFYFVEESAMATKTPTNYMDLPQSVQVLSHELISDQAAKQTSDLYRSISGMTQFSYSGVTARGFRQDQVRYDGVQGDPYSGFSIPQLFNIERVEVLKGPTGMLYGAGQPGGLLNYVTKKPKFSQASEIALVTGNEDLFGAYADTTGAVDADASLAYRLGGFYQSKKGFRKNTDEKNTLLSAGLSWIVNDRLDLTLQYDFIDQDLGGNRLRGVPVDDNGNFLTDISYNANEKSDFQRLQANVWQLIANSEISDQLSNTTVVRILDNKRTQNYHENRGLADDGRTMTREFRDQVRENKDWSITTDFIYQLSLADMEHTWLFGADYFISELHYEAKFGRGAPSLIPDLDIISPVYGADSDSYLLLEKPDTDSETIRHGVYIQDQIRLNDHWLAIAGVRYDNFEDKDVNNGFNVSDHDYSPRLGAIYQPDDETSIFANITRGFAPQSLYNQQESTLDDDIIGDLKAETSVQHELGIKNQWLNNTLLTTVTAYHIVKDNVSSWNPADTGINDGIPALVQIGEVTSKGLEIDVVGDISENWTATVNYAYNRAKITGGAPDAITNAIGDEFANAPDHTLGAWTRWDMPALASSLAFGFDYVSERLSLSGQKVKPYTVWDASWRSEFNGVEMQINLKNLFDKEYATSGFNERNGHFPGEPRSIQLQLSYSL